MHSTSRHGIILLKTLTFCLETKLGKEGTILSQRSLFRDPRSSTLSLKGAGFVGSVTFFSGRFTSWKSGRGRALNLDTWRRWKIRTLCCKAKIMWFSWNLIAKTAVYINKGVCRSHSSVQKVTPLRVSVLPVFSPSVPCAPAHADRMRTDTFLHGSSLQVWVGKAHSGAQEVPSLELVPSPVKACVHNFRNSPEIKFYILPSSSKIKKPACTSSVLRSTRIRFLSAKAGDSGTVGFRTFFSGTPWGQKDIRKLRTPCMHACLH